MKIFALIISSLLLLSIKVNSQSTASKQVTTFNIEAPQLNTHKKSGYIYQNHITNQKNRIQLYTCMMLKTCLMLKHRLWENGKLMNI